VGRGQVESFAPLWSESSSSTKGLSMSRHAILCVLIIVSLATLIACGGGGGGAGGGGGGPIGDGAVGNGGRRWYVGGTLHDAGALEWQTANEENKLATCADFLARLWKVDKLSPKIASQISTIDDLRPFAQELVTAIDTVTEALEDPAMNKKVFTNQSVQSMVALLVMAMGYVKDDPDPSRAEFDRFVKDVLTRRKEPAPPAQPVAVPKVKNDPPRPARIPKEIDPEKQAASQLQQAKHLQEAGQIDGAKRWLDKLIKAYPNTRAAGEAKRLLREW
jgi:hypothetical protein